jgi:hypothetical protein
MRSPLGRVFKLQPQENAGDRNHGCIICGQFLISGSDATKLLDSVNCTFHFGCVDGRFHG